MTRDTFLACGICRSYTKHYCTTIRVLFHMFNVYWEERYIKYNGTYEISRILNAIDLVSDSSVIDKDRRRLMLIKCFNTIKKSDLLGGIGVRVEYEGCNL